MRTLLSVLAVMLCLGGPVGWTTFADEPCAGCDSARFPESVAYLDSQGLSASEFDLLLTWTEAIPQESGGFVTGYRLKPLAGGDPFDLYADPTGTLWTEQQATEQWGVGAKAWDFVPQERSAESSPAPVANKAAIPSPVPYLAAPQTNVVLPPLDLDAIQAEDKAGLGSPRKSVKRIGAFQDLATPVVVAGTSASAGDWQTLDDDSRVWSIALEAPGAVGQRVHFAELSLPAGAEAIVYNADNPGEAYGPYAGPYPGESDLWADTCFSERVAVEVRAPTDVDLSAVRVVIDRIIHMYVGLGDLPWAKAAGSCNRDVSCYTDWAGAARGVGGIGTVGQTGYLWCTGTLIADSDTATTVPYFLTAHHCVSSQSEASTLEVYWLYQTGTCNGTPPSPTSVSRTRGGADYLAGTAAGGAGSDFALLRLRDNPPSGLTYVGWSNSTAANHSSVTCIHHPDGDYKRISFGEIDQSVPPTFGRSSDTFYGVYWNSGVTEPGSSGSPLFNSAQQFIGQLWGGTSSCSLPNDPDAYGRFDRTFPLVAAYLAGSVRVLKPNGGETWKVGSTETIQWAGGAGVVTAVKIELVKGSQTVRTIANGEPNDGTYAWPIPVDLAPGPDYRIRVTSTNNAAITDLSDQPFTLLVEPELTVSAPNGGETWSRGSQHLIRWSALGASGGTVRIELRKGEATVLTIAEATENDGEYEWVLPESPSVGNGYGVYIVTNTPAALADTSDGTFSISNERNIMLTRPNGGETFLAGRTEEIRWASNGLALSTVQILLFDATDPDHAIATIADSTSNDGLFEWDIPSDFFTGPGFRVRIVSQSAPPYSDESDEAFAIDDCAPEAPASLSATDGSYSDRIRLQWSPVEGATEYRVYRSRESPLGTAEALTWWIAANAYDDYTAEVQASSGCNGTESLAIIYYYWVVARNGCAESGYSAPDTGYRGTGLRPAKTIRAGFPPMGRESAGDVLVLAAAAGALVLAGKVRVGRTIRP